MLLLWKLSAFKDNPQKLSGSTSFGQRVTYLKCSFHPLKSNLAVVDHLTKSRDLYSQFLSHIKFFDSTASKSYWLLVTQMIPGEVFSVFFD